MNNLFKAHLSLVGATLIFGINYWVSKSLMPDYLRPLQLTWIRMAGGCLLFYLCLLMVKREKIKGKDLVRIAIAGISGTTLNLTLFFSGLNLTSPVDMSLIHVSNPIFVMIIASAMIHESITPVKVFGIILGGAGAVILILNNGQVSFSADTFTGNLLAVLNTVAYAFYLVMIKPVMRKYHPITVMFWVFLFGFISSVPLMIYDPLIHELQAFGTQQWISMIFIVVGTTFLGSLLTIFALKFVEAGVVSFYNYVQPFIVTLIAFWLGKQEFTPAKVVASVMIFGGVYLVSRKRRKQIMSPPSA